MSETKDIRKCLANSILEHIDNEWYFDKNTYIVAFEEETDSEDDSTYHVEVEYHADEKRFVYMVVYEDEAFQDDNYFNAYWKKQIENHILDKVTNGKLVIRETISFDLTLEIDNETKVGEVNQWLKNNVSITFKDEENIKLLSCKQQ